jgi:hypothetical protein
VGTARTGDRYIGRRSVIRDRPQGPTLLRVIRYTTAGFPITSVESIRCSPSRSATRIEAWILVERESQKGIVIGKGGSMLKRVGMEARKELEGLLGSLGLEEIA